MDFLTQSTHLHITTWVITLILFFVAALASKKLTAVHMTLRLFYILVIVTGALLYFEYRDWIVLENDGSGMIYDMKFLFGILLIGGMEMVLVGKSKGKKPTVGWILFAVSLIAVLLLGLGAFGQTTSLNLF